MEETIQWSEMKREDQKLVVLAYGLVLKCKDPHLVERIFTIGNPFVVLPDDRSYCRVAPESVGVMKVLIDNYII